MFQTAANLSEGKIRIKLCECTFIFIVILKKNREPENKKILALYRRQRGQISTFICCFQLDLIVFLSFAIILYDKILIVKNTKFQETCYCSVPKQVHFSFNHSEDLM